MTALTVHSTNDTMSNAPNANAASQRVDASEVGWLFVHEYYTFMNKEPARLHCFYNKKSAFLHGHEGEQTKICFGQQDIHERIMEMGFKDCRVLVSNVDTQASLNNGIVVQVLGEMSNNGGASHKFAQTFFLAEQPNGYYVLNDIFRFLKEDIDNAYEETEAVAEPVIQEQFVEKDKAADPWKAVKETKVDVKKTAPVQPKPASPVKEAPAKPVSPAKEVATKEAAVVKPPAVTPVAASTTPAASTVVAKPVTAKPEPTKEAPQATPAKPKTWANLAATDVGKFAQELSPAKGQVLNTVKPASPPKPAKAEAKKSETKKADDDDFKPVSRRPESKRASQDGGYREDREKYSVYIKGLAEGTTEKMLGDVFSKVGPVRLVDILPNRTVAFVEYDKVEHAAAVIGQTFVVNGATILAEEKRKLPPKNKDKKKDGKKVFKKEANGRPVKN